MHVSVKQFTFFIMIALMTVVYITFGLYFFKQQERTAVVIYKTITNDMYSLAYTLSKDLASHNHIQSLRPILDRTAIDNDFIETILILKNDSVLITTDPFYDKSLLNVLEFHEDGTKYSELNTRGYFEEELNFYYANERKTYRLLFLLDKNEIFSYFTQYNVSSFIYLAILPIIIFILIFALLKYFLATPLEKLRQFAYYQSKVPSSFKLSELEVIRYSMIQTFSRLEKEKNELYIMSRTDDLSGLANRNSLNEHLNHLIENAKRNNLEFAFLFLDLDDFKSVNDSLGHDVGDELLKHIASIIKNIVRDNDFVARIGGDEFIIVLQEYASLLELTNVIDRIQGKLAETMVVLTHPININSSVGVALYPHNGEDILSLMKHSDIAMYEAKNKGKAQYYFFTDELNQRVQDVISLDKEMRKALINDEYELYYQPKVNITHDKVIGVEALIRWRHPQKGLIPPDTFIPLAEENSFILELGNWVLEEAIHQSRKWKDQGVDTSISINVSTKQLLEENFLAQLKALLKKYNVDHTCIDLEITEYLLLKFNENNSKILHELHDYGVSISLDDFGTGYSSLSYLKKFPIDNLKIDKAFMDDFDSVDGAIFIETIVKMGQVLRLNIIAEGIESAEQVSYLKSIGCDQYQGYYYSKPLPATELTFNKS